MKRIVPQSLFLLLILCLLTGCASSGGGSLDMDALISAMTSADTSLPEMTVVTSGADNAEELFGVVSDLDYSKVAGFARAYASDGSHADEIVVIQVKGTGDVSAAEQSLNDHLQGRKNLYSTYGPDQVARVENALVFTQGDCAVLIISDDAQSAKTAFTAFIS